MTLNGGAISPAPTRLFTGAPLHPFWFDVLPAVPRWRQTSGTSSGTSAVNDTVVESFTTATLVRDWEISVIASPRSESQTITSTSNNEAVATVSGCISRYVSDGSATITLSCTERTFALPLMFASEGGLTTSQFSSYVSGSACRHASDQIDNRLAGKSAASALRVFTTQDHAAGVYVRNQSCWCADVDTSCVSVWNSSGANTMAGVLISPRHVLFAAHYRPSDNAAMRFVTMGNVTVERTLADITVFPGYAPYHPDFAVGVLDSDVPAGVGFARVLPADYATKFPGAEAWGKVASVCFDQERKALVQDWAGRYFANTGADYCGFIVPTDSKRLEFYESKVIYDSGSPFFLIINGQLVFLTPATYGGPGSGTELPPRISTLNSIMTALGGGYTLTEVDLSGFPSYP